MNNRIRAALAEDRPTFGSWIQFGHLSMAEAMAQAGFEWLVVDLEHSAIDITRAQELIQVVELAGAAPLVRLSSNDPVQAKRVMDAGAHGVIVPSVNSKAEAERAVEAVRYPPRGRRGVGLARAHGYGARFKEYLGELEEFAIVVVMIEHRDAIERIDEIVAVQGVDAVFSGPYDLSASYGIPGQFEHPLVRDALTRMVTYARAARVAPGLHVVHPPVEQVRDRVREGFRFIAYAGDMLLFVPAVRAAVAGLERLS